MPKKRFRSARRWSVMVIPAALAASFCAPVNAQAASRFPARSVAPARDDAPPIISAPAAGLRVGTATSFTISAPAAKEHPTQYQYSLNSTAPVTVSAKNGKATIAVTPTRLVQNVLQVYPIYHGRFGSQPAVVTFNAEAALPQADGDLNGDSWPDQLTVGTPSGTPGSGLWLTTGTGPNGTLGATATNIGVDSTGGSPLSFDGGQAITGEFTGGPLNGGFQDQLVYFPATGNAFIYPGTGNGTIEQPITETFLSVPAAFLTNDAGNVPTQLVNAGNTALTGDAFPDLLATASPGDSTLGLYLFPNGNAEGVFNPPIQLIARTPEGQTDWSGWKLASTQSAGTGTNLFLWNTESKSLYLWTDLGYVGNDDGTSGLSGRQYLVSDHWTPGDVNSLEAADLNLDGTPDLRVISTSGAATAYLVSDLPPAVDLGEAGAGSATVSAQPTQVIAW